MSFDPDGAISAGLNITDFDGLADSQVLEYDLTELLVSVGEAAQAHKCGVVLLIDEIQFLDRNQLESLIMAIHKTVQRALPITLVGAGLPQIAELAGDAKSYSERLFTFPKIDSLDEDDARKAFADPAPQEGVIWEEDALQCAIDVTEGYPYFIQELGSAVCGGWHRNPRFDATMSRGRSRFSSQVWMCRSSAFALTAPPHFKLLISALWQSSDPVLKRLVL
ncbi:ATP-binding protein [Trueperella bernardiae]|uniref:ATP-binding protein n=1 Tax=Trueperella bernardiae TaxID=59561 RepID=UPI000B1CB608|nr:ATP-binding protein [Trueperella bernardiae]